MNQLLCDGDWTHTGSGWDCTGAVAQVVYSAPVEYTAEMAMDAVFAGFTTVFPVFAAIFGGRLILKALIRKYVP